MLFYRADVHLLSAPEDGYILVQVLVKVVGCGFLAGCDKEDIEKTRSTCCPLTFLLLERDHTKEPVNVLLVNFNNASRKNRLGLIKARTASELSRCTFKLSHQYLCRKNQEKLTRANNVFIRKYQSISSPGWLSVSEVAYNLDWIY